MWRLSLAWQPDSSNRYLSCCSAVFAPADLLLCATIGVWEGRCFVLSAIWWTTMVGTGLALDARVLGTRVTLLGVPIPDTRLSAGF